MTKGPINAQVPVVINGNKNAYSGPAQKAPWCRVLNRDEKLIHPFLFDILTQATPHGHEELIIPTIEAFIAPHKIDKDEFGNVYVRIGENIETMFSCHLDTVHTKPERITLMITEGTGAVDKDGFVYAARREYVYKYFINGDEKELFKYEMETQLDKFFGRGLWEQVETNDPNIFAVRAYQDKEDKVGWLVPNCTVQRKVTRESLEGCVLGADDKVGIYIMCRLIKDNVPGLYVFHLGEECGGKGSSWAIKNNADAFKGIKRCVAFDRMDYDDVIAFQANDRTASKEFTEALAQALNDNLNMGVKKYRGDVRGVWTDSANYVGLIQECTNVSVGYFKQHGPQEHFDAVYLEQMLIPALLKIDWSSLPTVRDTNPKSSAIKGNPTQSWGGGYHGGGRYYEASAWGDDWLAQYRNQLNDSHKVSAAFVTANTPTAKCPKWDVQDGWLEGATNEGMKRIVYANLVVDPKSSETAAGHIVELMADSDAYLSKLIGVRNENNRLKAELSVYTKRMDDLEQNLGDLARMVRSIDQHKDGTAEQYQEAIGLLMKFIEKNKIS